MKRIILAALLVAAACGKKDQPATGSASGSAPVATTGSGSGSGSAAAGSGSAAAGSGSAAAAADVPTEQDFEDEASKKIDEKNVEAQVKAIEQDLGSGQ